MIDKQSNINIKNDIKNAVSGRRVYFLTIVVLLFWGVAAGLWAGSDQEPNKDTQNQCTTTIISEIGKLENNRDPKCHATATRLENFMYGTKLAAEARFLKVKLQKQLLLQVWKNTSDAFNAQKSKEQGSLVDYFKKELGKVLNYSNKPNGDVVIGMKPPVKPIILEKRDMDHYFSVAYALRAILALQQETMFREDLHLVPLDPDSVASLKNFTDIFTLAVLQVADGEARVLNSYEISAEIFQKAWDKVLYSHLESEKTFTAASFWESSAPQAAGTVPPGDTCRLAG